MPDSSGPRGSIRAYVQAARLRTLPLAGATACMGGALGAQALGGPGHLDTRFWWTFGGAWATVWTLQILSNFANDLGDAENGADRGDGAERGVRADRAVASGRISAADMRRAVIVTAFVACLLGISTVGAATWGTELLLMALGWIAAGLVSIAAAYRYTAGRSPYGYKGWGDLAVLVFFGWIGVTGTAVLTSGGQFAWSWLMPATFVGAMGMAVLNLNNMRDASRDAATEKKTLALRLGVRGARVYHAALFVVGWALLVLFLLVVSPVPWRGWYWMVLMALVHAAHLRFVFMKGPPEGLDDELKKVALSTALVALAMLFSVIRG